MSHLARDSMERKIHEPSVESMALELLSALTNHEAMPVHAFTGGTAFASYHGHFSRRADLDMVIHAEDLVSLDYVLQARGFSRVHTQMEHIICQYSSPRSFFEIDVHLDRIVLALPDGWDVVGEYDLREAIAQRETRVIHSLDGGSETAISVVPVWEHFVMKLLPPIEPHNIHDLLYAVLSPAWGDDIPERAWMRIHRLLPPVRSLVLNRLVGIRGLWQNTIWAKSMGREERDLVDRAFGAVSELVSE